MLLKRNPEGKEAMERKGNADTEFASGLLCHFLSSCRTRSEVIVKGQQSSAGHCLAAGLL